MIESPPSSKKVVVQADLGYAEHITPDRRQRLLHGILRGAVSLLWRGIRQRQGFTVELAIGGHRQFGQVHPMGRHHVFRQAVEQPALEVVRRVTLRHQIGHQLLAALHQHHGFAH